ncbi:MAG: hypothetical protein HYT73_01410 [Candidatus Aenigmarchaeota archaeon]|nr:hypothetical protein [Candidatus Aenigmarchaeota archaeon]
MRWLFTTAVVLIPVLSGADDSRFFTAAATSGGAFPASENVFGGSAGLHNDQSVVQLSYQRVGLYKTNALGLSAGYSFERRILYILPTGSGIVTWNDGDWKFGFGAGLEAGVSLEFLDFDGRERVALRVELVPDEFDTKVGGHFGDVVFGPRLEFGIPF